MMNFLKEEKKIIFIYILLGFAWIYFSDTLLYKLAGNSEVFRILQSFKGTFYVLATAVLLYLLIKRYVDNLKEQKEELNALNEELTAYNEELLAMNEELDQSLDELNEMNEKFISMINLVSDLDKQNNLDQDQFLSRLLKQAVKIVPEADYGKVYLIEDGVCRFIDAVGHDIEILKNLKVDQKSLFHYDERGIFTSEQYSINLDKIPRKYQKEFKKALKEIKDSLFINIEVNEKVVGRISLDIAAASSAEFRDTTKKVLQSFAMLASSFFAFKRFDKLQGKFTKELISSIIRILEIYDSYTKGHSENVANLAANVAEKMGLSRKMVVDTYWAGMVHDIGKLLVPVNVLNKKGKLTEEEYQLIKKHPLWGSQALANSAVLKHISKYILYHHERWDGNGYPEGIEDKEIPLVSQIIAVADSWDAMRSERSYRKPLSKEEAIAEIENNKGSQFSPEVADRFLELVSTSDFSIKKTALDSSSGPDSVTLNEDYFEYLFEESAEGIVVLDSKFRIIKSNKYFLDMFDYKRYEVLDKHIKDVVVPGEKSKETDRFIELVKNGERVNARTFRENSSGEKVEVSVQGFPISLAQGKTGYYIIYQDISEFKDLERKYFNSQQKYRALFENEDIIILIIDPETGQIIDANPAAENFYDWNKAELKSKKISEINVLSPAEVKAEMRNARANDKNRFLFKHRLASGEIKKVEVYSQPIKFEEKEYLYSIVHELKSKEAKKLELIN
ncbi:HD domain-containing phosphohydrolase [Halanaerobium sp. ST460_2HS_T2]|uniref:HD domain-containing phosphohydrolase n=1 Tax=Halanaerobium sp. ST460_2HS_T2 TaxID=2183914 RepID=UPI000DFD645D|nr:HD domain-containing phosphohydrolase [Halanaerobium sp. ST460_2HS_T2]RCW57390.1 PAS domain S-box-containing protein [Halanaerobium sp. ST460_2HS_T2]